VNSDNGSALFDAKVVQPIMKTEGDMVIRPPDSTVYFDDDDTPYGPNKLLPYDEWPSHHSLWVVLWH
jgi:hypothetical protein